MKLCVKIVYNYFFSYQLLGKQIDYTFKTF